MPFTPGGTTDILAREIAAKLQVAFGQSCIVENRPGGGGTIGCELVARSDPDGLTMLMGHIGTLAINPLVFPHHSYDPVTGWTPLAYVANVPNVLAVNPSVAANSVAELVALAKAKPGALAYGNRRHGAAPRTSPRPTSPMRPAPTSCTCPTRERRRLSPTWWAASCRWVSPARRS